MKKGIFITGTDTGVGKTFVSIGLMEAMQKQDINVCPMKPVESGCRMRKGNLFPADAVALMKAASVKESIDLINPYRLRNALAPSVAAELEGMSIGRGKIHGAYKKLIGKYDRVIVEGAGGIMVPIYKKYLFLDLAYDLGLSVVIISRPGLGTINHTLLTIEAAKSRGLNVEGVIINHTDKKIKGLSEKTNPAVIAKLSSVPVLGIVPFSDSPANYKIQKIFQWIAEKLY